MDSISFNEYSFFRFVSFFKNQYLKVRLTQKTAMKDHVCRFTHLKIVKQRFKS